MSLGLIAMNLSRQMSKHAAKKTVGGARKYAGKGLKVPKGYKSGGVVNGRMTWINQQGKRVDAVRANGRIKGGAKSAAPKKASATKPKSPQAKTKKALTKAKDANQAPAKPKIASTPEDLAKERTQQVMDSIKKRSGGALNEEQKRLPKLLSGLRKTGNADTAVTLRTVHSIDDRVGDIFSILPAKLSSMSPKERILAKKLNDVEFRVDQYVRAMNDTKSKFQLQRRGSGEVMRARDRAAEALRKELKNL